MLLVTHFKALELSFTYIDRLHRILASRRHCMAMWAIYNVQFSILISSDNILASIVFFIIHCKQHISQIHWHQTSTAVIHLMQWMIFTAQQKNVFLFLHFFWVAFFVVFQLAGVKRPFQAVVRKKNFGKKQIFLLFYYPSSCERLLNEPKKQHLFQTNTCPQFLWW